jgi:hypothetical protein
VRITIRKTQHDKGRPFGDQSTKDGKEATKPTRLVAGKFSLRCYCRCCCSISHQKKPVAFNHSCTTPEKKRKEEELGAEGKINRKRKPEKKKEEELEAEGKMIKENQGIKTQRTGPRQSHCSSFARVTLHVSQRRKVHEKKSQKASGLS